MSDISQILAPNEHIVQAVKPRFWPHVFLMETFLWLSFPWFTFWIIMMGVMGGYFKLSLLVLGGLWLAKFMIAALRYGVTMYYITDKRTIVQRGLIGRDFQSVEHDKYTSVRLKVTFIDKLFGGRTGSILIEYPGAPVTPKYHRPIPQTLMAIPDPQTVMTLLEKIAHDVRTDIRYPNALRPEAHSGYDTQA